MSNSIELTLYSGESVRILTDKIVSVVQRPADNCPCRVLTVIDVEDIADNGCHVKETYEQVSQKIKEAYLENLRLRNNS